MIKPLPHWVLTDKYPSVYDRESVTAISMVGKLYGRMQELIADYNEFVDGVNAQLTAQDEDIAQAIEYIQSNLEQTVTNLFNEALDAGNIKVKFVYNEADESLTLSAGEEQ